MALLLDVGLGYMRIGQPSTTLSGGEAQRIKLATELSKRATGKTIYILDEPTTGLHFEDVRKLMEVLQRLAEGGNTLVIIEHNLDVMKCADYLIDLGPEGGVRGGTVVATGTPEQLAAHEGSHTGAWLRRVPGIVPAGASAPANEAAPTPAKKSRKAAAVESAGAAQAAKTTQAEPRKAAPRGSRAKKAAGA
jgi:excinuclease ABC subunit A